MTSFTESCITGLPKLQPLKGPVARGHGTFAFGPVEEADEIAQTLEMLVRSYDPCISCSTHVVRL